jgi:transcriptional regulator GlxA family with amidase domain
MTSVCTGALLLAKAGLLEGLKATTHWASIKPSSKPAFASNSAPVQTEVISFTSFICWRIHFITRQQMKEVKLMTSVCTGALLLAKAGLLEGLKATTHWAY